jgi:hypothetical protein
MTELSTVLPSNPPKLDFKKLFQILFQPGKALADLATREKPAWLLPMLLISLLLIVRTILAGYFQVKAAAMGQVTLPVDWQYWSPAMQNNYMQAQQATQGPVFVYIIPLTLGLVKFWLAWFTVSGLTHLTSTLFGGRGKMVSALNVTAWACLPFVLRDIVRIVFMLVVHHSIASPGLSGMTAIPFLSKLLIPVDLFFIWFIILMIAGIHKADNLSTGKAIASVLIVLVVGLLAQAGVSMLTSKMGGLMITRPF